VKLVVAILSALLVLAPAPASTDCAVDDATLTWGFKESFRSYISGTIANGEWTVADGATYETPNFGFSGGTGSYDGTIAFAGSIRFTGHGGILDTTVANPELRFDGGTAKLYLDVRGTTQEGEQIDERGVEFATIDLSGHRETDKGKVSIVDAPATLTGDGAVAFGTYESGEALDPITVTFTTGANCVAAPAPIWLFGVLAILLALAVATVVFVRRRGQGA
jgi:hypothetical protein